MATWVAVIARTAGRADFWDVARSLGVTAEGPLAPYVLIDCESRFGAVRELGRDLSRALDTETIAFVAQTTSDVHAIWVHHGGELVRELEYSRDDGGWQIWSGTRQSWEPAYFFGGDEPELDDDDEVARYRSAQEAGDAEPVRDLIDPSSTENLIRVCEQLGLDGRPAGRFRPARRSLWRRLFG